jgi:hypothetical protein
MSVMGVRNLGDEKWGGGSQEGEGEKAREVPHLSLLRSTIKDRPALFFPR